MNHFGLFVTMAVPLLGFFGAFALWRTMWKPMMRLAQHAVAVAHGGMPQQGDSENLRLAGLPAQARILGVQPTGYMTNFNPHWRIDMDVYSQHAPPYRVSVLGVIHQLAIPRVQPGLLVPVRIDRSNPVNVVLDV